MMNAKDAGVTMMVHAENADIITILTRYYLSQGKTAPVYHYYARPPIAEEEATGRAIALAKAADCPFRGSCQHTGSHGGHQECSQ